MRVVAFGALLLLVLMQAATSQDVDCAGLNGCSGHGQCRDSACVCHSGWGGDNCAASTTNCSSHCHGHGLCLNGLCQCNPGFAGPDCALVAEACPGNCSGHGMCHNGQCVCLPGYWEGEACDVEIYNCPDNLNNCTGRGECGPSDWETEGAPWVCTCEEGFCGDSCDQVCGGCPKNCSGQGTCTGGACVCGAGFGGPACDRVAAIHTCPNNCTGQGICARGNGSTYSCQCFDCFSGPDCSNSSVFCPGGCSSQGHCGCDGKCYCRPGFTGIACEIVQSTCAEFGFCSGNGVCRNSTCKCNPGFAGPRCDLACHTGGSGDVGCHAPRRGRCVAVNDTVSCVCKPEYEGIGCENNATSGLFDEYVNGWNPIGTIVLGVAAIVVCAFVSLFVVNYAFGKRGVNAVPGISGMRSTVKGDDYHQSLNEPRSESNY